MDPPHDRGKRPITAQLDPSDYRALYEVTLHEGVSMAETLRRLIRRAAKSIEGGAS